MNIPINRLTDSRAVCMRGQSNLAENVQVLYATPSMGKSACWSLGGRSTHCGRASQTRFSRSARKASEICLRASEKTVVESLTGLVSTVRTNNGTVKTDKRFLTVKGDIFNV